MGRGIVALVVLMGALVVDLPATEAEVAPAAAVDCTVTATLVNPCRPWLGVVADHYPGVGAGVRAQSEAHEARIGRRVDVVHTYKSPGQATLTTDEKYFVNRGTILYINWRPLAQWSGGGGANAAFNAQVDAFANQIKALGLNRRVMLSIHGEAERFVSPGTSACPGLHGTAGSPAQYKAMWANIQDRFAAAGASNVVWVMNFLGYQGWDCLFPEVWPGNDRVDWITWDPYLQSGMRWDTEIGYFYRALEQRTDAAHAFTSKPWGIAEYGSWRNAPQSDAYRIYDDAKASLEAGRFPRIKLYEPYDTINIGTDVRIGFTGLGLPDPVEQAKYNAFANSPVFNVTTTPPATTTNHLAGCDVGIETAISCFRGMYASPVRAVKGTGTGQQGTGFALVTNSTTAAGAYGINLDPRPVSSTQAGRTYSGEVWVQPQAAGRPITLLLREARANGTAPTGGYTSVTVTPSTTGWQRIRATYTAKEAGNTLSFSVYGTLPASGWFRADSFALTSTAP